jgi:ribosomal peptide maturation radical SAM protein 1
MKEFDHRIALIVMPMYTGLIPSIQIGLVKSILKEADYQVDDYYFNLSFSKIIGHDLYEHYARCVNMLLGEWLFSSKITQDESYEYFKYFRNDLALNFKFSEYGSENTIINKLIDLKNSFVSSWLEKTASQLISKEYSVIGFSCSVTQLNASLRLASIIKERNSKIKIIAGGSCFEGPMGREIAKWATPFDCIIQGEGEQAVLKVLEKISNNESLPKLYSSGNFEGIDINNNPVPDYTTYFKTIYSDNFLKNNEFNSYGEIPIEASRGCWWAEMKDPCRFCGFCRENRKYKTKKSNTIIKELEELSKKHSRYDFLFIDNILNPQLFGTLFDNLAMNETSFGFSCEIKSNTSTQKLEKLKKAGVHTLQPGIESLNTKILKLMNKGCTATHNILFLLMGRKLNVNILWNFLLGVPYEKELYYHEMIRIIPSLYHLQPPKAYGFLRMDRFSDYYYKHFNKDVDTGGKQEFHNVRPASVLKYLFHESANVSNLCYYFEAESITFVKKETYKKIIDCIEKWQSLWFVESNKPNLSFKKGISHVHVIDDRYGKTEITCLENDYFKVVSALEKHVQKKQSICNLTGLTEDVVKTVCNNLIKSKLILDVDGNYIWLPIKHN